jgi:hypothetical protein
MWLGSRSDWWDNPNRSRSAVSADASGAGLDDGQRVWARMTG